MNKIPVELNEKHIDNKGFELDYIFIGDTKDINYDCEDIKKAIHNYFINSDHSDFVKDAITLRSMLSDVREEYSVIRYEDIDKTEYANYVNNILFQYEYNEKSNNNDNESFASQGISVKYNKGRDVEVIIPRENTSLYNKEAISKYKKMAEERVNALKFNPTIKITPEENLILYVYYLFYGEYPDFTDNNTFIKFQAMNNILSKFIGRIYADTYLDEHCNLYVSTKLKKMYDKLYSLGKIDKLDSNVDLTEKQVLIINMVGSNIAGYLRTSRDYIGGLKELAKIFSESEIVNRSLRSHYVDVDIKKVNAAAKLYKDVTGQITKSELRG